MAEVFYNPEIKNRFLNSYAENTRMTYKYLFIRSMKWENFNQKDLCEFDKFEFMRFFQDLDKDYLSTARSNGRIVTAYIDWAIKNSVKKEPVNILKQVSTKWFDQFVNQNVKLFYTKEEIRNIIKRCVNPQDAVIISLIFDGVQGKAVSEIRNLKESDVDFDTGLTNLMDEDGSTRNINLTETTLNLIERAYEEGYYAKSNGMMQANNGIREFTELLDNEYVVRSSNTGRVKNYGPVDKYVIYRRISNIEKSLELDNFNIKNISRSGMLSLAKDMMEVNNSKLNLIMLINISNIYNVKSYNTLKNFITEENIFNLYGFRIRT